MPKLTHFNEEKRAKMVDVSEKTPTLREAAAVAAVFVNAETFKLITEGMPASKPSNNPASKPSNNKGDVLAVAQVAGITAAKRTSDIIPMCHPVNITGVDISFEPDVKSSAINIKATVRCMGVTGVEMEALTAVSAAALTIYDMCKAAQKDIRISDIRLVYKTGGKEDYYYE